MIDWSGLGHLNFELPKIDPEAERTKTIPLFRVFSHTDILYPRQEN